MLKRIISFILLLALMVPSYGYSQATPSLQLPGIPDITLAPLTPGETDVGDAISPLRLGHRAPVTGVLVSNHATAHLLVDRLTMQQQCQLEVTRHVGLGHAEDQLVIDNLQARLASEVAQREAQVGSRETQITDLTRTLNEVRNSPTSSFSAILRTVLWTTAGLAVGAIVGATATLLIK